MPQTQPFFVFQVDLGQIIIIFVGGLLGVIGWFTKKEITRLTLRLDRHDSALFDLAGQVQRLIGYYEATKNHVRNDNKQG